MKGFVSKKEFSEDFNLELWGPLESDGPLYLYLSPKRDYILYSTNLKALLDSPDVEKPLTLSEEGLSFYLLSGVIPTPRTIYKEIFVLSLGDRASLNYTNKNLAISFHHQFPFHSSFRQEGEFKEEVLLKLLRETIEERIPSEGKIYLFQSLGKDSNTIVLALHSSYLRENITCLTLSTGDKKDESSIAEAIAKKLGFRHQKLYLPESIDKSLWNLYEYYFTEISHPCIDGTSLVYPIYASQLDFKGSYVVDGSGNDVYFGHVPRPIEYKRQKLFSLFHFLRPLSDCFPTGNPLQSFTKTRAEWIGLSGFTLRDAQKIYSKVTPIYNYWKKESKERKNWDYFDLKADLWGTHVEFDLVMRKVRNFGEVFGAEIIFPWYNKCIAEYIGRLPENLLFDRENFRNKIPLRELLKKHLTLDSDKLGKYSYGFDAYSFLLKAKERVRDEIFSCELWNKKGILKVYHMLKEKTEKKLFRNLFIRLFILSTWYNHNKYLKSID